MKWESRPKVPNAVCPALCCVLLAGSGFVAGCSGRLRKFTSGSASDFADHDNDNRVPTADRLSCLTTGNTV